MGEVVGLENNAVIAGGERDGPSAIHTKNSSRIGGGAGRDIHSKTSHGNTINDQLCLISGSDLEVICACIVDFEQTGVHSLGPCYVCHDGRTVIET